MKVIGKRSSNMPGPSIYKTDPVLANKLAFWVIVLTVLAFAINYFKILMSKNEVPLFGYTIGVVQILTDSSWEASYKINGRVFRETSVTPFVSDRVFIRFEIANPNVHYILRDTIPKNKQNIEAEVWESLDKDQYFIK